MVDKSSVTIIVPHLGSDEGQEYALDQCLLSLKETVPDIKVLLAVNGGKCQNHKGDVIVDEQGQCKAVNEAVKQTDTEWIMVSNDDMVYPPNWFEKLTNPWPKTLDYKKVFCVSPKLIEPRDGAPTFEKFFAGGAGGDFDKDKFYDFAREYYKRDTALEYDYGWRTGFNLPFLIKKELWDMVSGYDTKYDPLSSNSDSDLEYKIKLAGVQPYQNTNCIVYHFSNTSPTFWKENRAYLNRNYAYFEEKWGFPRTDDGIWEANFEIPKPPTRKFTPEWEGKYK